MRISFFSVYLRLAICFLILGVPGCGSDDPEPEAKAPAPKSKKVVKKKAVARPASETAKSKPSRPSAKEQAAVAKAPVKQPENPPKEKETPLPVVEPAAEPPVVVQKQETPPADAKKAGGKEPAIRESFDKAPDGGLPEGWAQWVGPGGSIQLASTKAFSKPNAVAMSGGSKAAGRAWLKAAQPADVQVSAAALVETLIPAQVIARGKGLDGANPTFYAAVVTRGLEVKLDCVTNGKSKTLASVRSAKWFSEKWVRLTLRAEGKSLAVQLLRLDTNEYLDSTGNWQPEPAWALRATDEQIAEGGRVGIGREAIYAGTILFDDFAAGKPWDEAPPPAAAAAAKPAEKIKPAAASRPRTEAPIVKVNAPAVPRPEIPRHYSHIRIALLAYHGNPMGAFEDRLLRESVDLVVPDDRMMEHLAKVSPKTPALIYTNTSSLYLELLTDWLAYADKNGLSREAAFYHARSAKPFRGDSPSSLAVNRFWKVLSGGTSLTDHTSAAHLKKGRIPFENLLYLGWPDRFREINFDLVSGAGGGWKAVLEYPTAVDDAGKPTAWAKLATVADTTNALARTGQVTFDPPADWKPAVVQGEERLYYVRFRKIALGTAPVASTILGRDYVNAHGTTSGVIPAFDSDADANKDGYLDDAEYARRAAGKDARFMHESRMFCRNYGQMRFATNPSGAGFSGWGVDYHRRFLAKHPLAAGLFMDNSEGKAPVDPADVLEPVHQYAVDYGAMVGAIGRDITPRWVLANTAGGGRSCEPVIQYNPAYFEEFVIRPTVHNWTLFEDIAEAVGRRARLTAPPPIAVLDSYPGKDKVDDPRLLIGVLAYYYLLADPDYTFLCFFGGYEPGTAWSRHWTAAVSVDVGRPQGKWSVFATGEDPAAPELTYKVYQRQYEKALVLYKPISHGRGSKAAATTEDSTATQHDLGGTYQPLQADGTLGDPITKISLRNGEGAVLIKAKP
jgi:hypothetical protein